MPWLPAALIGLTLWANTAQATEATPDAAFYRHASDCTAALKARVEHQLKQAPSDLRNQAIQRDTELGFLYVGLAYKRGLRNPEADQMLKEAESRLTGLTNAARTTRTDACAKEGEQLFTQVSGLERYLVRNRAKARVDKLLHKEQARHNS